MSGEFAGHTPGPWVAGEKLTGGTLPIYQTYSGFRMEVARVNGRAGEMEANARLIAAAPSLLAERGALRQQVAELREALAGLLSYVGGDEHDTPVDHPGAVARAALAKVQP